MTTGRFRLLHSLSVEGFAQHVRPFQRLLDCTISGARAQPCRAPKSYEQPSLNRIKNIQTQRPFSSSSSCYKSGGKQHSKRTVALNASKTPPWEAIDPLDMTEYESAAADSLDSLKVELQNIKAGGRLPEVIEAVRVQLKSKGADAGAGAGAKAQGKAETARLGDLAVVMPRGRTLVIMVGEKDHVKPITSALQSPPHNINPTLSPTEPLVVSVPIPPTTQESRQAAMVTASQKGEQALFALREARGAHRKRLRSMELAKKLRPDEARKAEKELDKLNERAVGDAKKSVDVCRKGLESH